MDSEEERDNAQELAEEALVRSNYRLSTLYELNQELSALRNVSEALEASLFSIVGVFGLRRGLIALYKGDETQPREFVCSGMQKRTAQRWFQQLEAHLGESYVREVCVAQDAVNSPLTELLKENRFSAWLPLQVDEGTWGGIALGVPLLEMAFTEDDRALLSTIAINVQNVLNNVALIETLNQMVVKERRIRDVFQRYAPESVVAFLIRITEERVNPVL